MEARPMSRLRHLLAAFFLVFVILPPLTAQAMGFREALTIELAIEGSVVVANDAGHGVCRFGIVQEFHREVDVLTMTVARAIDIYRDYWKAIHADDLPDAIRLIAFDASVNFGPAKALRMLAEAAGDALAFAQIRIAEHARLLRQNPGLYGPYRQSWKRRDERMRDYVRRALHSLLYAAAQ